LSRKQAEKDGSFDKIKCRLKEQVRMDRYKEIRERLYSLAESDEKIKAMIIVGSSARTYSVADEYSDLDVIIVTEEPEAWLHGEYPARLGNIKISFIETTFTGIKERRILYEGDLDLDLVVLTPEQFMDIGVNGPGNEVLNRGYVVLHDAMGITGLLEDFVKPVVKHDLLPMEDFINMVNDFLFHVVWAAKKIQRGELWTAKMCIDSYLKNYLLRVIEMYAICVNKADVWHNGRFLEEWADEAILRELKLCFAHYDKQDMITVLISTHKLFSKLAGKVAGYCGYSYPDEADIYTGEYLGRNLYSAT